MNNLDLDYQNPEGYTDIPDKKNVLNWIRIACQQVLPCALSLRITSIEEAQELNRQYRKKNYATNILSFPFEPPPGTMQTNYLGDLVLCKAVTEQESLEQRKPLYDHWAHLIIHGTLHLQGYDHSNESEAREMEALEVTLLKKLGIKNPYQSK